MKTPFFCVLVSTVWLSFGGLPEIGNRATSLRADQPPNIVLIMADDLGYGELGSYGQQQIKTPNLDRLATQGMRLTHHYSGSPVCASSRCVLLTGQHTGHAQIRGNRDSGNGRPFPGQWPLTAEVVTISSVLQRRGYATGGFGKWGLGPTDSSGSPLKHGFDRFYGYNCQRNAHSFYPPFLDDDEGLDPINEKPIPGHLRQPEGAVLAETYRSQVYAPDRIREEALLWLDANHDRPFFLYLPLIEPHVAMHPPQAWIDRYPEEWDREFGAYRGENGYLPHPRPRAAYAAMISHLDDHVGAVLNRLDELGVADRTLVIFTSDNGPTHAGTNPNWHVGGAGCDFFNSNAGLKGYKGSCDEGGIRVPCIVRWPGQVAAGSSSDFPSYFPDWFPTLARIAEAPFPESMQPLDGIDLTSVLTQSAEFGTPPRAGLMVWEFPQYGGVVALRTGAWKAVRRGLLGSNPGPWELYNLVEDPGERNDLATEHPELVQRLVQEYLAIRSDNPVFPLPIFDQK